MAFLNIVRTVVEDPAPTGLDFSGLISALTSTVTAQQIIGYMAAIVGAGMGIYLAYVFGRKLIRAFANAVKGKKPTI